MNNRSNKPENNYITAFLSCSVRPADRSLVDAIETKVLSPMGFRCLTVGRNISIPDQPDDAIRDVIEQVDCLIGVATVRLEAAERSISNQTLKLASPYILQESAMAHQQRIPFLIFKTPEVTLQGVTSRNLYIQVRDDMPNGRPVFLCRKELVMSALEELKKRAHEHRQKRSQNELKSAVGKLSTLAVSLYGIGSFVEWLTRPNCFGTFYHRAPECRGCEYRSACKVEKMRQNS
jgi:hypothetical protein